MSGLTRTHFRQATMCDWQSDKGLDRCLYGVVILSEKTWSQAELNGLIVSK